MTVYSLTYSFPNFELVCCSIPVLTVASWPAYRFVMRQVVIYTVKGFRIFSEVEADGFFFFLLIFL